MHAVFGLFDLENDSYINLKAPFKRALKAFQDVLKETGIGQDGDDFLIFSS